MSAAKHRLDNLVAIVDYNKIQSAGPTAVIQELEPLADKWRAFGFETVEVNGHDVTALEEVLGALPRATGKPTANAAANANRPNLRKTDRNIKPPTPPTGGAAIINPRP